MRKMFDEDEEEYSDLDKKKILAAIIPFVLIIVILAITFLSGIVKKDKNDTDVLQQSIMDYADEHGEKEASDRQEEESTDLPQTVTESEDLADLEEAEKEKEIPSPAPTPFKDVMEQDKIDLSKVTYNAESQLKEMMAYWEDNNQKALDDLANLKRFMAMSWSLRGTDDCYYYGEKDANGQPSGTGIAVYRDNQYYYGEWKNGLRSGNGTWVHYHIHLVDNTKDLYTYHQYTGSWENDLPSGSGSEHYDYNTELFQVGVGYDTNLVGSYLGGLVHGEFFITNLYSDGNVKEWNAEADHGSWLYQSENKDRKGNRTVYVDISDPDNYIWMQPKDNVKIGVPCLFSKI